MDNTIVTFGRRVIYTAEKKIDKNNVVKILKSTLATHLSNRQEIDYLYNYYKGRQPILNRPKDIRPEINNKVVENRANEIVSFKVGYLMGEPLQYISRKNDTNINDEIIKLNDFVFVDNKQAKDKELADWFYICGTAFRMILPSQSDNPDDTPFNTFVLDPRNTYVVRTTDLGEDTVMGVRYVTQDNGDIVYSIYTNNTYFEVSNDTVTRVTPHTLGDVPIIEYPANNARLGAFEIVLSLLDALNKAQSNRLDGLEQFVQSIMKFINATISEEDFLALSQKGAISIKSDGAMPADVDYMVNELNQTQVQTLVDYLYQTILTICGMPNRNGGSSTSDTGSAVIMRDGWSSAEARAKDTELMFKKSERELLKLAIRIMSQLRGIKIKLSDIEIRFTRRNYENILQKSQVLSTMLASDKIHPQLAFAHCGMFADSVMAYTISQEYYEEQQKKLEEQMVKQAQMNKKEVGDAETKK